VHIDPNLPSKKAYSEPREVGLTDLSVRLSAFCDDRT
jgi:hypothetical protein